MTMVLSDQYTDVNAQAFHAITSVIPEMPDFVKSAKRDLNLVKNLPPQVFGDPINKRFPGHTRGDTWQSYAYFMHQKVANLLDDEQADMIQERLDGLAKYWGITGECEKIASAFISHAARHTDKEPFYCLNTKHDGKAVKKFPVINAASVKIAAERFMQDRDNYPYEWRRSVARNLLSKSMEFVAHLDSDTNEYLRKAAGYGVSMPLTVVKEIADRIVRLGDLKQPSELQQSLAKLAMQLETKQPSPDLMHKVAEVIDKVDRTSGLYRQYKTDMMRPEEFCFAVNQEKLANLKESIIMMGNHIYKRADLERLPLENIKAVFGADIEEHISDDGLTIDSEKLAAVVATFPRPDMSLMDRVLAQFKIEPVA